MKRGRLKPRLSSLADDDLIRIGQDKDDRYDLDTRVRAREILKAKGYRFIGGRVERDEREKPLLINMECERKTLNTAKGGREDTMEERKLQGRHKQCKCEGCDKYAVRDDFCSKHFKEHYGYAPYNLNAQNTLPCGHPGCRYQSLPGLVLCKRHKKMAQKVGKQTTAAPEAKVKAPMQPEQIIAVVRLTIDFTGYPQLYERLVKYAQEEFRTPEMQTLMLINASIDK